jgi:hypothetical protein
MNDPRALGYGILIYVASVLLSQLVLIELAPARRNPSVAVIVLAIAGASFYALVFDFAKIGICHLMAKWFSGGDGTYLQLLRPLLLGSVVYILLLIPLLGVFAAGLAWLCVFIMVFQEVDDLEGLTAFLYSAAVNAAVLVVRIWLTPSRHL